MAGDFNDADPLEAAAAPEQQEAALEEERGKVLNAVSSTSLNNVEQKVAWILNNYPESRDSDITLALRYWSTFEDYDGGAIDPDDLYKFARQGTLTRARAHIQNKLKLFQASPEVREHRGTLADEERDRDARAAAYPVFSVYADESGKTQERLVVGSVWVLHGPESFRLLREFTSWRNATGFTDELHFTNVNEGNIGRYEEAIQIVLTNANAISFKSATVERRGVGNIQQAVGALFYHLIAGGIEHETRTGRAPLPRTFQLWKDAEEAGYDKLLMADIGDRLRARFQDQLVVDVLRPVASKGNHLVQIADIFAGSINRRVNPPQPAPAAPGPKDRLATYVLAAVGWAPTDPQGDMAVSLSI